MPSSVPEGKSITVVKEFGELGRYTVRVIRDFHGRLALDIRKYVETQNYKGFTKQGIWLRYDDLEDLKLLLEEAAPLLKEANGGRKVSARPRN